jgi:hypothetical protein
MRQIEIEVPQIIDGHPAQTDHAPLDRRIALWKSSCHLEPFMVRRRPRFSERVEFATIQDAMKPSKKSANPFYALLIIAGIVFVVTAAAYGVMAVREAHGTATNEPVAEHALVQWMSQHGNTALLVELAILGTCTVGAIATDEYWQRRTRRKQ